MPPKRQQGPRSGSRVSKVERRAHLLAQAKALFLLHGFHATTTEQIASAAGVTEAVLTRHFPGKEACFLEVLHEIRQTTLGRWQAETARVSDPLARLQLVADHFLNDSREPGGEMNLLHRALMDNLDQTILASVRAFYLESEMLLARIILEGQQAGVFRRSLDPRVGAWELMRTILGHTLVLPLNIPLFAEPDYPARAVECFLHGLLKTDV